MATGACIAASNNCSADYLEPSKRTGFASVAASVFWATDKLGTDKSYDLTPLSVLNAAGLDSLAKGSATFSLALKEPTLFALPSSRSFATGSYKSDVYSTYCYTAILTPPSFDSSSLFKLSFYDLDIKILDRSSTAVSSLGLLFSDPDYSESELPYLFALDYARLLTSDCLIPFRDNFYTLFIPSLEIKSTRV